MKTALHYDECNHIQQGVSHKVDEVHDYIREHLERKLGVGELARLHAAMDILRQVGYEVLEPNDG